MAEKQNTQTPDVLSDGSAVARDEKGRVVSITDPQGTVYEPRALAAKFDAETVKKVEDYRWPRKMKVSDVVVKAVEEFIANHIDKA